MTQVFKKAYTRNFSIIMQEAWFYANKDGLVEKLGLTEYPYSPPYIYFMKDGVEEVWENEQANKWLLDKVADKFKSDTEFFPSIYKSYFDELPKFEEWWTKEIKTVSELKEFIAKVHEGVSNFVIIYAALMINELPKDHQEMAAKFRESDVFFAECNNTIWKALHQLYPDLGYLCVYITQSELGEKIDKEAIQARDNGFVLIPGLFTGPLSFIEIEEKFPEYQFILDKREGDGDIIKGQIAYKGMVSGRVRILKRKDQIESVQDGEIIVSPMTTPDMMPAMHKAAGFITDEGGITCHAAIIAREMKKPCITGTRVATQVLKGGMMVELDAEQGIVKIL